MLRYSAKPYRKDSLRLAFPELHKLINPLIVVKQLFKDQSLSDIILLVGEEKIPAHRLVLCAWRYQFFVIDKKIDSLAIVIPFVLCWKLALGLRAI